MRHIAIVALVVIFGGNVEANKKDAGWETNGGDLYSLMFVKIGRALLEEFRGNPKCSIAKKISVSAYSKNLDTVQIETGESERVEKSHYVLNRMSWTFLPLQEKIRLAVKVYSGLNIDDIPWKAIEQCKIKSDWKKVDIQGIYNTRLPRVDIVKDARDVTEHLLTLLGSNKLWLGNKIDLNKFRSLVNRTDFSISSIPIKFRGGTLKDGVNTKNAANKIQLDEATWVTLNRGQKMELLFHEFLGLLGLDDLKYQLSSRLFMIADEKLYDG